jgi:hypothetical protein
LALTYQEQGDRHAAGEHPVAEHEEKGVFEDLAFALPKGLLHNALLKVLSGEKGGSGSCIVK